MPPLDPHAPGSLELHGLVDAASDLMLVAESDGRLRFLNRVGREVLGYSMEAVGRVHLQEIVESRDRERVAESLSRIRETGEASELDLVLRTQGGQQLLAHGQLRLHRAAGAPDVVLGVFRVAEGRAATPSRQSLAEDQIIQNVAREKELNELKSHFISMASHELRTPLAALSLGVDFLVKYWQKLPVDQINKNLKTVDATVRQLRSVLDDVLIISRENEGRLRCARSPVELVSFGRKVAEEAAAADQHRHPIVVRSPHGECETLLDPQLLHHILTNLLGNACKYSPPGSAVELFMEREDNHVTIVVADHGIGIPAEDQRKLFELFFRASNVGSVAGTGLGLVVVRRCVEAHHGTIALESTEGRGTHFTVKLPMEKQE